MKLVDVQRAFGEAIASERAVDASVAHFVAPGLRDAVTQLETYREQFWLRHVGCMVEDYPTLQAILGEAAFEDVCRRFFAAYPPSSYLLRDLGAKLAAFLEAEREERFLVDLAKVEWAFIDAFDAADAPPLDPTTIETLAEDEWPRAVLHLHPSLQLLDLAYPAEETRAKFRLDGTVIRGDAKPTPLVIYRRNLLLYVEPLEPLACALLMRLQRGEALGPASEAVATGRDGADVESKLGEWFARWAALGFISRVVVGA
ncbi:hypothetical protein BH09MYX1_BH09MYX1_05100 [soil metagenome]